MNFGVYEEGFIHLPTPFYTPYICLIFNGV